VHVVGAMTRRAGDRRAGPHFVDVAAAAGDVAVRTDQIEVRRRVVERHLTPRPFRSVAGRAVLTEALPVWLVVAVAADAGRWRVAELLVRSVAGDAADRRVPSPQRKIGSTVIETVTVEAHDVGVATDVLGVTRAARLRGRVAVEEAVQTASLAEVGLHCSVTVETQHVLLSRDERTVALPAIVFEVGVTLDDGPGHHESLEAGGPGVEGSQRHRDDEPPTTSSGRTVRNENHFP
jgi:hypothetical protein